MAEQDSGRRAQAQERREERELIPIPRGGGTRWSFQTKPKKGDVVSIIHANERMIGRYEGRRGGKVTVTRFTEGNPCGETIVDVQVLCVLEYMTSGVWEKGKDQ